MILGIDATNIIQGGGITHLKNILNNKNKEITKFEKIIIWGNREILKTINYRKNIKKINVKKIENKPIKRFLWQIFILEKELDKYKCNHALILGGIFFFKNIPATIILQNLLPFDHLNIIKYRLIKRLKLFVQKKLFLNSILNAKNIIFLSKSSKKIILNSLKIKLKNYKIIPHGINKSIIIKKVKKKKKINIKNKFKILYVSKIEFYKNQLDLIKVAKKLKEKNYNIVVNFVGPAYEPALKRFNICQNEYDPKKKFTKYLGNKSFKKTLDLYRKFDLHVVPSTCESFGQIVLEAMARGLPNACSDIDIFREITNNNSIFFKPGNIEHMTKIIKKLILSENLRYDLSTKALKYLKQNYSWNKSSYETFKYIND